MENKRGFYYILVQPSALAFWQCRAMADADAVAVAELMACMGMPPSFCMSLYMPTPFCMSTYGK